MPINIKITKDPKKTCLDCYHLMVKIGKDDHKIRQVFCEKTKTDFNYPLMFLAYL